jgi:eukaryotic-like serine/threonine-protein kinase
MQQEKHTLPIGATVQDPAGDRYVVESLLGQGGLGAVYLVRDRRCAQNLFALKEIIDPNKHDRARFSFEGEVLKRLNHKALPCVYRVFEQGKRQRMYLLMDYIEGQNLEVLLKEQPAHRFSLPQVLTVIDPIVDALSYLHRQQPPIVHRDVKPANIIVPRGGDGAVLVDFDIAKEYVTDATTGMVRHGSAGYAAPEHYGSGTSPRTDLYSLGATIYTLLTGMVPPHAIDRAVSKGHDPLEPANVSVPAIPNEAAAAIGRAMSISPDDRYETVGQFWQELTALVPEQQEPLAINRASIAAPRPRALSGQRSQRSTGTLLKQRGMASVGKRRGAIFAGILAVLFIVILAIGSLSYALRYNGSPSVLRGSVAPPASPPRSAAPTVHPTHYPLYPALASAYAGTVVDLMTNEKTALYLTAIEQSGGRMYGFFQGLGLTGSFEGVLTQSGQVQFRLAVGVGDETIVFDGDVKIGGDMVGSFDVVDRQGYRTGEFGLWNVAPAPNPS